ncbi:MAG TPA: glycosyltransferase, partial [Puia sp.]|nr:glycosyltransferase [Puia sp.]
RYYYQRFKKRWRTGVKDNYATLFTEMRGCFWGWIYYHTHKKDPGYQFPFSLPQSLYEEIRLPSLPLVSVIIPCYNLARYLSRAIESVKKQTHQNCEIIVVDDGSDDDPASVCRKYEGIAYLRVERVGVSAARNIGLRYSHGSLVVFLDADDWLSINGIETNLRYFSSHPQIVFVSGAHDKVTEDGNQIPTEQASERAGNNYISLLQGNYIGMEATVMYRRELFYSFHFDPTLRAGEDYDMNLRIMRHFPVYGHTEKIATYFFHQNNSSHDSHWMLKKTLDVMKKQEKNLKNEREREALREGIRNWKNYYLNLAASKK